MTESYFEPESSTMEWKEKIPQKDQIIKTLIAFCNQHGGRLVIGVKSDGTILGVHENEIDQVLEYLDNACYQATHPPIIPSIYAQRFGDKQILVIEVSGGMSKPYFYKSEGMVKGTYIRLGRSTLKATPEIIEELKWQARGLHFDGMPVYRSTKKDFDLESIKEFLDKRENQAKSDLSQQVLQSYHLTISEHAHTYPTTAGILLFGNYPQNFFSEAMIICTHFAGTSGRDVIRTVDCGGSLFEQFRHAYSFVLQRLQRSYTIQGPKREEILEIPPEAIREAILNVIVHRNYHMSSPSKISIYDDRVEIFSPGSFAGPINLIIPKSGITYIRNPAISKVFREAGLVEKMGTGLITIFDSYEKRGLPTPQLIEGENFVKWILPRREPNAITNLPEHELILSLLENQIEVNLPEIMKLLNISRATASRRLKELVDMGKVQRIGRTRSIRFRLA